MTLPDELGTHGILAQQDARQRAIKLLPTFFDPRTNTDTDLILALCAEIARLRMGEAA